MDETDVDGNNWEDAEDNVVREMEPAAVYHIRSAANPEDYWSNELGWTTWEQATTFTESEAQAFYLPIDGEWTPSLPSP